MLANDKLLEFRVLWRIGLVKRRSQQGDGPSAGLDGGAVRGGINASGQSAHDEHLLSDELSR